MKPLLCSRGAEGRQRVDFRPQCSAFRLSIGHMTTVVGWVHVATSKAARSRVQTARSSADRATAYCRDPDSGLGLVGCVRNWGRSREFTHSRRGQASRLISVLAAMDRVDPRPMTYELLRWALIPQQANAGIGSPSTADRAHTTVAQMVKYRSMSPVRRADHQCFQRKQPYLAAQGADCVSASRARRMFSSREPTAKGRSARCQRNMVSKPTARALPVALRPDA